MAVLHGSRCNVGQCAIGPLGNVGQGVRCALLDCALYGPVWFAHLMLPTLQNLVWFVAEGNWPKSTNPSGGCSNGLPCHAHELSPLGIRLGQAMPRVTEGGAGYAVCDQRERAGHAACDQRERAGHAACDQRERAGHAVRLGPLSSLYTGRNPVLTLARTLIPMAMQMHYRLTRSSPTECKNCPLCAT